MSPELSDENMPLASRLRFPGTRPATFRSIPPLPTYHSSHTRNSATTSRHLPSSKVSATANHSSPIFPLPVHSNPCCILCFTFGIFCYREQPPNLPSVVRAARSCMLPRVPTKSPDYAYLPMGSLSPTVAFKVGWVESFPDSMSDDNRWRLRTRSVIGSCEVGGISFTPAQRQSPMQRAVVKAGAATGGWGFGLGWNSTVSTRVIR